MPELISATTALQDITRRAQETGLAAIDTEFVWTSTYYPRIGLIQIAVSDTEMWLVDAPNLSDVSPLKQLLEDPHVVKILHDASGDLTILSRLCNTLPKNIFDMRLAAGFCGLPATLSLGNLAEELLGVHLPKTESRSDWLQRPLTPEQLEYALDDVLHVPDMYRELQRRLTQNGTTTWAHAEMRLYEDTALYQETVPEEAFRNVKGMGRLAPRQLAVLRELTAWRECTARREDRTRSRILKDEHLLDIAGRSPTSKGELQRTRGIWRKTLRDCADEILDSVRRGTNVPREDWPHIPSSPLNSRDLKDHADALLAIIKDAATERGIDPTVVGPRRSVTSLVLAAARGRVDNHSLLEGWRAELLEGKLERAITERGIMPDPVEAGEACAGALHSVPGQ